MWAFVRVSSCAKSVRGNWSEFDFDREDLLVVDFGGRFSGFAVKSIFWELGNVGLCRFGVGFVGRGDLGLGWSGLFSFVGLKLLPQVGWVRF